MVIFSLIAMTGLEKCCITSAYLQWLCHSGEQPVARGPLVLKFVFKKKTNKQENNKQKNTYLQIRGCIHIIIFLFLHENIRCGTL